MTSREPSAAPSSGGDTIDDQADDVKPSIAELEHEDSAADLPAAADTPASVRSKRGKGSSVKKPRPKKGTHVWINEGPGEGTEDESAHTPSSRPKKSGSPDPDARTQGTAVGTRRQANGTVGSVYSGSKVRHIKKPDGTPLWRKEIQYEFLRLVIEDKQPVFTRISDGKENCTFAEIYVDCMGRSSKTSKILKERLQVDQEAAQNMAMICLLVNVGRMNTTLNFFPEMRAQLRTYHSIPSLQAYKSQKDYKGLQDAPRLKSILKGASEDTDEPRTLAAVKSAKVPRTNPVNLIFVLSQSAPEVAQLHFIDKVDFFDLAIRPTISSASRAKAFLWLMWWYLESTVHDRQHALNNPFGPGLFKEDQDPNDPNEVPQLVPQLIAISEEEADAENVDPPEEKAFAQKMTNDRKRIMAEVASGEYDTKDLEHKGVKRLKKSARDFDDDSDADSARASPGVRRSPAIEGVVGIMPGSVGGSVTGQADSIEDDWEAVDPHPGRGKYKRVKSKSALIKGRMSGGEAVAIARKPGARASAIGFDRGTPDARQTPQPLAPGTGNYPTMSSHSRARQDDSGQPTKSRARTGYQRQLEEHRNSRIQWLLRRKQRDMLQGARIRRESERWLSRATLRIQDLDATYDSEEDEEDGLGLMNSAVQQSLLNGGAAPLSNGIGIGGLIARRALISDSIKPESEDPDTRDVKVKPSTSGIIEDDDYGEEAEFWMKIAKRTKRRMLTWSGEKDQEIYIARKEGRRIPSKSSYRPVPRAQDTIIQPMRRPGPARGGRRGGSLLGRRSGLGGARGRNGTPASSARARRAEMSLNDEITQDLLAERSDDDDQDQDIDDAEDGDNDGDDAEGDGEGDGEGEAEGEGEGEGDGDIVMDDNGEGEEADDSDVDMD